MFLPLRRGVIMELLRCYGLHVIAPPKIDVEILTSNWDAVKRWGLWEVIKF